MMKFWKECSHRLPDQIFSMRHHELRRSTICQFDESPFIDGHDGGWAGFYKHLHSLLRFQAKPPIPQNLRRQQTASAKCQGFKAQPDVSVGWIQIAESLAETRANDTQQHDRPAR